MWDYFFLYVQDRKAIKLGIRINALVFGDLTFSHIQFVDFGMLSLNKFKSFLQFLSI